MFPFISHRTSHKYSEECLTKVHTKQRAPGRREDVISRAGVLRSLFCSLSDTQTLSYSIGCSHTSAKTTLTLDRISSEKREDTELIVMSCGQSNKDLP
jgi:hypothetical protein